MCHALPHRPGVHLRRHGANQQPIQPSSMSIEQSTGDLVSALPEWGHEPNGENIGNDLRNSNQ